MLWFHTLPQNPAGNQCYRAQNKFPKANPAPKKQEELLSVLSKIREEKIEEEDESGDLSENLDNTENKAGSVSKKQTVLGGR